MDCRTESRRYNTKIKLLRAPNDRKKSLNHQSAECIRHIEKQLSRNTNV